MGLLRARPGAATLIMSGHLAAIVAVATGCGAEPRESIDDTSDTMSPEETSVDRALPPKGWTCRPGWWGEGWCDCGCGVVDELDCVDDDIRSCVYNACEGEFRPDPWETPVCQPTFFSCNPDHVFSDQLPRRYPLPETPEQNKPPREP